MNAWKIKKSNELSLNQLYEITRSRCEEELD